MSTVGLDPVSMFWKMLLNAQELNQLTLKAFLNTQKVQQSQESLEQLLQEYMMYVGDNTSVALSMVQALSKVKNPEEFVKTQEKLLTEYSEKNLEHTKKFLNLYNNLWQEIYHCTKENTSDFTEKCTEAANDLTKKFTENVNKFAETAATLSGAACCKGSNSGGGGNNKRHQNVTEHQ